MQIAWSVPRDLDIQCRTVGYAPDSLPKVGASVRTFLELNPGQSLFFISTRYKPEQDVRKLDGAVRVGYHGLAVRLVLPTVEECTEEGKDETLRVDAFKNPKEFSEFILAGWIGCACTQCSKKAPYYHIRDVSDLVMHLFGKFDEDPPYESSFVDEFGILGLYDRFVVGDTTFDINTCHPVRHLYSRIQTSCCVCKDVLPNVFYLQGAPRFPHCLDARLDADLGPGEEIEIVKFRVETGRYITAPKTKVRSLTFPLCICTNK